MRSFALYGDTTGETDEYGLPVRYPWADEYRGKATVVYGHTPTLAPEWVNNTICVDTGCVFGGRLTAVRYPERELVSVPAERVWYEPAKPLAPPAPAPADRPGTVLDVADVLGRRVVETADHGRVGIREENAAAAIEVMSRFAVDPRWLVYLPPTMAPPATSARPELLEHPADAFDYFRAEGVDRVVCERKHMGSRAVVVLAASVDVAAARFGVADGSTGAIYTRTGRPFFADPATTETLLAEVRAAVAAAGVFDDLGTDWLALDTELLPWSAKARDLIRDQYAAVGAAARAVLPDAVAVLDAAVTRGQDVECLARHDVASSRQRVRVRHRVRPVLLAERRPRRRTRRAVPGAGGRGGELRVDPRPRVAPRRPRSARRRGPGPAGVDRPDRRGRDRYRVPRRRDAIGGST